MSIHHGVTRDEIVDNCGWPIRFAEEVIDTPVPTEIELATLRDINARTKKAHQAKREAA
ncbi:3-oxoadipate CoA-transferase subunit B [compost metagenome]